MASEFVPNPAFMANLENKVRKGLARMSIGFQGELKKTLTGASPSKPGDPPGTETGSLRRSVQVDMTDLPNMQTRVGTNLPYGRYLEYGARIRPKKAKALAVPLTKAAKRHSSPRDFPKELQLIPRKGRAPLLVETFGKRKTRMILHYVLLPEVNLAARPWMRPTAVRFDAKINGYFKGITR
jgi:phage gpG-like protein